MAASLLVAGYELIGGTVNPEYRLAPGFDFGAGEPDQSTIASLYLDGDTVSGERTKNRTISLPLTVMGISPQAIAGYVSTLLQAVSTSTFTMQWTPDGGLPLIFDCYRAVWSRPERSLTNDAQGVTNLLLTFQASPFGRSPVVQTVAAQSTLQVDSFDTAPTGATLNTTTKYEGTGSASFGFTYNSTFQTSTSATVSRAFAAKNISTFTNMGFRVYTATSPYFSARMSLTLSSASGSTSYVGPLFAVSTRWALMYVPLTGGAVQSGTGVDLTAVTGYSFLLTAPGDYHTATVLVDDMRAAGSGSTIIGPTTHAAVLSVPMSLGAARTPVNLSLSPATGTMTAFLLHSPPEDQESNVAILSSLSNALPDQTVTLTAANSRFAGTYAVVLGVDVVGSGSITATVTITQKANGTTVGSAKVITKTYTAGPRVIPVDNVTLPLYDVPVDNTTTSYTIEVAQTGAERYTEVMLLDTRGQTVFSDSNLAAAAAVVYVDEPSATETAPSAYATATDRTAAYGIPGNCLITGGPVLLEPGTNKFLAWVGTSTPSISATYYPRWLDERSA